MDRVETVSISSQPGAWSRLTAWVRARVTIARWISAIVIAGFLLATSILGYMAMSILSENKRRDFWAMIFMTAEIRGAQVTRALQEAAGVNNPGLSARPSVVLKARPDGNFVVMQGPGRDSVVAPADLKLQGRSFRAPLNVVAWKGRYHVARLVDGSTLWHMWPLNVLRLFGAEASASGSGVFYAVTTEGELLLSTSRLVTATSFASRNLVQKFITNHFRQGQLEYKDPSGTPMLGVFFEVPESNVVLFHETPRDVALAPVFQLRRQYVVLGTLILMLTIVLVLVALRPVVDPITDLVRVAGKISAGDFSVRPVIQGIGETEVLNMAFQAMGNDLKARDEAINRLHEEQKGKIRLEAELAVAKSIQDNFMPGGGIAEESGLVVATSYQPAAEAAGDWYCHAYDFTTGESVLAIADVSGHGAGSAMFTAIIAGMFEYHRRVSSGRPYPVEAFVRGCNHLILTLGRTKWHATMQLATWKRGDSELLLYNAGHPPAVIVTPGSGPGIDAVADVIAPASHVIGMAQDFDLGTQKIPFPAGSSILFYTDGLLEGANKEGTQFGQRRILRTCRASAAMNPADGVRKMLEDWEKHLAGQPADDDVCIMVAQRRQ